MTPAVAFTGSPPGFRQELYWFPAEWECRNCGTVNITSGRPGHPPNDPAGCSADYRRVRAIPSPMHHRAEQCRLPPAMVGRAGSCKVATAALFLASREIGFITGMELSVDGGAGQV